MSENIIDNNLLSSEARILDFETHLVDSIHVFAAKTPSLRKNEITAVLLYILTEYTKVQIKDEL